MGLAWQQDGAALETGATLVAESVGRSSPLEDPTFLAITSAVFVLLFGVFVAGIGLVHRASQRRAGLHRLIRLVESLPPHLTVFDLEPLEAELAKNPPLDSLWEEFKEGLVKLPKPFEPNLGGGDPEDLEGDAEYLHNGLPLDHFFTPDAYLDSIRFGPFTFAALQSLPGVATSLGILGTFLGVTVGLMQLKLGGAGQDASLNELIASLGSAFVTSVMGVITSMVLGMLASHGEASSLATLGDLRHALERKVPRVTPEWLLLISTRQREQSLGQAEDTHEVAKGTRDLLGSMASTFADIRRHMAGQEELLRGVLARADAQASNQEQQMGLQAAMVRNLGDLLGEIRPFHMTGRKQLAVLETLSSAIGELKADSAEVRAVATEQLGELEKIRQESEESRGQLQTLVNDLADRFDQSLQNTLGPQLQEIVDAVRGQISSASENSAESARTFTTEMVSLLNGTLQQSFQTMGDHAAQLGEGVRSASEEMAKIVADLRETTEEQRRHFESGTRALEEAQRQATHSAEHVAAAQELAAGLSGLVQSLADREVATRELQASQTELHTQTASRTAELAGTFDVLTKSIDTSARQLSGVLPALASASTVISTAAEALAGRTETAARAVESSSKSLVDRSGRELDLVQRFEAVSTRFEQAMSKSTPLLEQLTAATTQAAGHREALHQVAARLSEASQATGELAKSAKQDLALVVTQLGSTGTELAKVVDATEDWGEASTQAIEDFGRALQGALSSALKDYDASLAAAVNGLRSVMEALRTELDDAVAAIEAGGRG